MWYEAKQGMAYKLDSQKAVVKTMQNASKYLSRL
jgi:hypothetical protein